MDFVLGLICVAVILIDVAALFIVVPLIRSIARPNIPPPDPSWFLAEASRIQANEEKA